MIRAGFLPEAERRALTVIARNGLEEHRVARRANALILLNEGWSCEQVARALLVDDDTVRQWYKAYQSEGIDELKSFGHEGSSCRLTEEQQEALKAWIAETFPRTTREIGEWIERSFGVVYESRSGLVALLHRLGMEHRKPDPVPQKLDVAKQEAFIEEYNTLLNTLEDDEAIVFADAVHPTHGARPVGCWAPKGVKIAVDQANGRDRLNIHGAIDLETGKTRMIDVTTVDAQSTIMLLMAIEAMFPAMRLIHIILDNARYHHAKLVQEWLSQPGRRVKLHFIPSYSPHLNPIERLWGLMHRHITHNRCYKNYKQFCNAVLGFLRKTVPDEWDTLCDSVTDNLRVISPGDFRVVS